MADDITQAYRKTFTIEGIGDFTLRRPTMWDRPNITRVRTQLLGQSPMVDDMGTAIADIIATINITSEDRPRGFDWSDFYADDWAPWNAFLEEYNAWMASFRQPKRAKATKAGAGTGEA